jgi:hypothetical protein
MRGIRYGRVGQYKVPEQVIEYSSPTLRRNTMEDDKIIMLKEWCRCLGHDQLITY